MLGPLLLNLMVMLPAQGGQQAPALDLSGLQADSGINVHAHQDGVVMVWPAGGGQEARLMVDTRQDRAGRMALSLRKGGEGEWLPVLEGVEPRYWVTEGTRQEPGGRPPGMNPFNTFFDSPAKRPFQTAQSRLKGGIARASSQGKRATLSLSRLEAGSFAGELRWTVYLDSRLVLLEAVMSTDRPLTAYFYDAGLVGAGLAGQTLSWMDTAGQGQSAKLVTDQQYQTLAVRHRYGVVSAAGGSVAFLPPPHSYFFPRDLTDNLSHLWFGPGHRDSSAPLGVGIRQTETGGGSYVPWVNAPPGTPQRMGLFLVPTLEGPEKAAEAALALTRKDRYAQLPGFKTFASHFHLALAVAAQERQKKQQPPAQPEFVEMFQDMGVDILQLAEFHGDGHPRDPGPVRLPEMKAMFDECNRLSSDKLLLLPGEEANAPGFGLHEPGKNPGHWMCLFPKPVYWTMVRGERTPFVDEVAGYGQVYRTGNRADLIKLFQAEGGLAWVSHPRIKASSWTPDIFRQEDFYLADLWLGAAWKAMPADLSRPKLGERVLDLLDDMANWGQKKYVLGEVDVFKLDHTHELFAHMNVNYLKLDRVPRFEEGWQSVCDALRNGQFFATTGEVLLPLFEVGGLSSGEELQLAEDGQAQVRAVLSWTFPMAFAEVISGDGQKVDRQKIDLADTQAFGERVLELKVDLKGKRWVRVEAWDVAGNGAFSQPIWIQHQP